MDSRKTSLIKESLPATKAWAQAVGRDGISQTIAVTSFVPVADLSLTIKTNGGPLRVSFKVPFSHPTLTAGCNFAIYVDGVAFSSVTYSVLYASYIHVAEDSIIVPVAAGVHKIDVYGNTGTGTMTIEGTSKRVLIAEEK